MCDWRQTISWLKDSINLAALTIRLVVPHANELLEIYSQFLSKEEGE
jgi:hypothetical protein